MSEGSVKLAPGTIFAEDFRVVRTLGAGGMGAVYVAEQLSTSTKRALKLMKEELSGDAKARSRFVREARVSGKIASEHVVQVVAAGVDASSGIPWLAMELLEGEDLAVYLARRQKLSASECVSIFAQLGHALEAAHAAGVVHRDLKPENIFLAVAKQVGVPYKVKVLDFGIARFTSGASSASTAAIGTPLWMAPEQTDVDSEITPATDLWPLGLIAFRALTGRSYWRGGDDRALRVEALLRQVIIDPLQLASIRAAELGCDDDLPPDFDAWFSRCVRREALARFPSVTAAVEALRDALGGPQSSRPLSIQAKTQSNPPPNGLGSASTELMQETPAGVKLAREVATPNVEVVAPEPHESSVAASSRTHAPIELGARDRAAVTQSAESLRAPRRMRTIAISGAVVALTGAFATGIVVIVSGTRAAEDAAVTQAPSAIAPPPDSDNAVVTVPPVASSAVRYELPEKCSTWIMLENWSGIDSTTVLKLCRDGKKIAGTKRRQSMASGSMEFGVEGEIADDGTLAFRDTRVLHDEMKAGHFRCLRHYSLKFDEHGDLRGTSLTMVEQTSACKRREADLFFQKTR